MNVRRGLFRLWVVASSLWLIVSAALLYARYYDYRFWDEHFTERRAIVDARYKLKDPVRRADGAFIEHWTPDNPTDEETALFREYNNALWFKGRAKDSLRWLPVFAFLPPLVLFVLGTAICWALAGFKASTRAGGN